MQLLHPNLGWQFALLLLVIVACSAWQLVGLVWTAVLWTCMESIWFVFMKKILIPRRVRVLRSAEAGQCSPAEFRRNVELAEFVIRLSPSRFWRRIAQVRNIHDMSRRLVWNYAKSLFYVRPDEDLTPANIELLEWATDRLEAASGVRLTVKDSQTVTSNITGWADDTYLIRILRSTPLAACVLSEVAAAVTSAILLLAGFRSGPMHNSSGLQCWIFEPRHASSQRPLVFMPGLGAGFVSILPFGLWLKRGLTPRVIILFRLPYADVGMVHRIMPQWDAIVDGFLWIMNELGATEVDLFVHSYSSQIANRVMRRLCGLDAVDGFPAPVRGFHCVGFMAIIDPTLLGDTTIGFSCAFINSWGPDINVGALTNRGGVPWKESMFFDPTDYGQCRDGILMYAGLGDQLLDCSLTAEVARRFVPSAVVEIDKSMFFHGQLLLEMACGGLACKSPSLLRFVSLLRQSLNPKSVPGMQ